jgi:ATP-binding cassette subfamily F protein 3
MLQLSNICKQYGDTPILRNISFTLNAGERLGLIGPNGCGKTTLLRIAARQLAPDAGSVQYSPPDLRVGYLAQGQQYGKNETLADFLHVSDRAVDAAAARVAEMAEALAVAEGAEHKAYVESYDKALADLASVTETQTPLHQAQAVLAGLGLDQVGVDSPVDSLSGGQKTRLGLARVLLHRPQLLLLDEPTNHLDIDALEWLEGWLQSYSGAVLLVTHDRLFLERTVNTILELDSETHTTAIYPGTFDEYVNAKVREHEKQWAAYKEQQERIARLRSSIRQHSDYARSIEHGTINFAIRKIAKGIARQAVVQRRRLERELAQERVEKPRERSWQMKLSFDNTPESGQDVLVLKELTIGYDGVPLLTHIDQVLCAGERVALIGANGAGKTTLLRVIAGELAALAGEYRLGTNVKMGYFAQEQETLDMQSTPLECISQVAAMTETDTRAFLHCFLFTGDDVFVPIGSLSHGERARLVLACLVASGCNFLLLDEPINHLDIPSRARFEQAMQAFEGTVLAVVHDRYFIQALATRVWAIRGGTLKSYVDLEQARRARSGQVNQSDC